MSEPIENSPNGQESLTTTPPFKPKAKAKPKPKKKTKAEPGLLLPDTIKAADVIRGGKAIVVTEEWMELLRQTGFSFEHAGVLRSNNGFAVMTQIHVMKAMEHVAKAMKEMGNTKLQLDAGRAIGYLAEKMSKMIKCSTEINAAPDGGEVAGLPKGTKRVFNPLQVVGHTVLINTKG